METLARDRSIVQLSGVNERPLHVLLVEDDDAVRRAFARALTADGFAVDETDSAESALTLANRAAYDIIVLDMSLPSRDGVWFIEELRSQGFETPIMVSSGRGGDADVEGALDAGADEYVIKPVSATTLSARSGFLLGPVGVGQSPFWRPAFSCHPK